MAEVIRFVKKYLVFILLFPLRILPIKNNRVVIHNDLTGKFAGNPRFVAEYLLSNNEHLEIILSLHHPENYSHLIEQGYQIVRFNSLRYFYYMMTTKVFLTNSGGHSYIPLRKKQYVINTGHGGGAYKKCGVDMFEDTFLFRCDLKMSARHIDACCSTCTRYSEVISESVLIPRDVFWEIGMPRNDVLIHGDINMRNVVRAKLGLAADEKLVLFAPTYRKVDDNYFKDSIAISYGIDCARVCSALSARFGGKWRFAFRLHPCVVNRDGLLDDDAIDLSDYEDIQDLLCAADAMINDFSSSMWDFMLTGHPCFTFAVDLDHYIQTTDVYTPVSEWPFPKATNNDELERNILCFDEKEYATNCKRHYDDLGGCETGKATQLVGQRIFDVCSGQYW